MQTQSFKDSTQYPFYGLKLESVHCSQINILDGQLHDEGYTRSEHTVAWVVFSLN